MGRVVHFEIHADNLERASKFYTELLDWKFTKWDGPMEYWLITTGADSNVGINGGLMKRMGASPVLGQCVNSYVCTAGVDNLDETLAKGQSLGAAVALPKMPVPGIGWLAYVHDTEGNILGLMQRDPNAK
ncbi:VOC family protein [Limnoglobus roseus]|uniref:VOC family protein n=1 Tax=Limnoglobus roseus TaxID=2598579 RepID=A0A5C1AHX6_9BACT|nr:VOC family protein [Limnoglobus roseus]QEL19039.1 VOC family protein [Limnoglobus roseus]